ncbi:SDR family oxidoreductase [Bacteroidota bacterium]
MKLSGKIVWITGASSGIGEATAYEMAKQGAKLILSSNQEKELEEVKDKCIKIGAPCYSIFFDLTDSESIPSKVNEAVSKFGTINILFNNGGISQRATTLETPIDVDRKIMEINYFGGIQLTKHILPIFINNGGGQIAVNTSIAGKFGFPLRSAYCASKHALYGFYETVRAEMVKHNVKVTFICPGRVRTSISVNALTKEGKPHGKMDEGQDTGVKVEKAAKQIVKAIKNQKREKLIGGKELLMVYIKKYLPWIFYKIVHKIKPT